jgi:hypothetical protein
MTVADAGWRFCCSFLNACLLFRARACHHTTSASALPKSPSDLYLGPVQQGTLPGPQVKPCYMLIYILPETLHSLDCASTITPFPGMERATADMAWSGNAEVMGAPSRVQRVASPQPQSLHRMAHKHRL